MKIIEFTTPDRLPLIVMINEIVVIAGKAYNDTEIYVKGNSTAFHVNEHYRDVIEKIKEMNN